MGMEDFGGEMPVGFRALEALGKGFDLSSDFRLKFAKGLGESCGGGRLVVLDETNKRDIVIPGCGGGLAIRGVSEDIRCDKGDRIRFKSDVLEFNQMSELLNQKSSVQGKVPSGYLNSIFEVTGNWFHDVADTKYLAFDGYFISLYNLHLTASPLVLRDEVKKSVPSHWDPAALNTKYLAFDGYFISLYNLHLTASPLVLRDEVKKSVPSHWDPAALSRFIESYGTHIIVGMAVGGQDLICVRQKSSSPIPPADLRRHLEDLGDILFSDSRSPSLLQRKTGDGKHKIANEWDSFLQVPEVFNRILQSNTMQLTSISETSSKDGLTVICSKRGGDVFLHSHCNWLQTVAAKPEAIHFKFVPIVSLLTGIPGSGYLSHAINLYLRYKPPLEDLLFFLEYQVPRQWAPMFCELPLRHHRRKAACPPLQFSFMGSKINISSTQVVLAFEACVSRCALRQSILALRSMLLMGEWRLAP
ncbi:hypothetical protein L484_003128 [Morus notabilis]|uniref:MACPF domain-containing protein n=1 Tax=Morus notabilis TaxID=981085 RepID=W9R485_9ROSA|nr:hypothetical protein L484_003128 [Morus notabilis]